jgi:hypothetical protein
MSAKKYVLKETSEKCGMTSRYFDDSVVPSATLKTIRSLHSNFVICVVGQSGELTLLGVVIFTLKSSGKCVSFQGC